MNLARLIACGIAPTQARAFLAPLSRYLPAFAISTPLRQAAFIGQCAVESGRFATLEESLYYRDAARLDKLFSTFHTPAEAMPYTRNPKALANRVYANRIGNGSEATGDGWRFRGRGLIQITGRANYLAASLRSGRDWIANPDDLLTPDGATLSAVIFFVDHGLNELADSGAIDAITKRINPAMVAAAERRQMFEEALAALRFHL